MDQQGFLYNGTQFVLIIEYNTVSNSSVLCLTYNYIVVMNTDADRVNFLFKNLIKFHYVTKDSTPTRVP